MAFLQGISAGELLAYKKPYGHDQQRPMTDQTLFGKIDFHLI